MLNDAIFLRAGPLAVDLDRRGAVVTSFRRNGVALMRETTGYAGDPRTAACFPLVPFGNRVQDDRFKFGGCAYVLQPNQPWDGHYLHGDGWLANWEVRDVTATAVVFAMRHAADRATPFDYSATSAFVVTDDRLDVTLTVENLGIRAMPFGLGLHPFFPLTPQTSLYAPAAAFYSEAVEFMPGDMAPIPADLNFSEAARLPRRWVNNGFSGWDGRAEIFWPEHGLALQIDADSQFRDYFFFLPDRDFDPDFAEDYFCFEPMTHRANAHRAADLGGLTVLAPGEVLRAGISFAPHDLSANGGMA